VEPLEPVLLVVAPVEPVLFVVEPVLFVVLVELVPDVDLLDVVFVESLCISVECVECVDEDCVVEFVELVVPVVPSSVPSSMDVVWVVPVVPLSIVVVCPSVVVSEFAVFSPDDAVDRVKPKITNDDAIQPAKNK
jgi:hypothetical protein